MSDRLRSGGRRLYAQELFDIEKWRSLGFATSRQPWLAREVAELRGEYGRLIRDLDKLERPPVRYSLENPTSQNNLEMLSHPHWSSACVERVARSGIFGSVAAELLGVAKVRLWGSAFICKNGKHDANNQVGWHRDMTFWQCLSAPRLLTFWIALDPVARSNGTVEFAAASHLVSIEHYGDDSDLDSFEAIPLEGPPGTVSVHHCLTGHRSGPNRSQHDRIAMTLHYMDADLQYVAGTPADGHINVPLIASRNNNRLDDAYFPVVAAYE